MIGSRLSQMLIKKGYKVLWLSRERYIKAQIPRYRWDYRKGEIDIEALEQSDIIIHLAGSNLGDGKWSWQKKQAIVESRVETAKLLFDALKSINKKPDAFISASAVGYYGFHTDEKIYTEEDKPAKNDFLSLTCKKWEAAAFRFQEECNVRTVALRTAFVIANESEGFRKMMLPVRFGLAASLGGGKQYFSIIHIDDICNLYIKSIEDTSITGVYNATVPEYITNREFTRSLAKEMNRLFIIPDVPAFLLRLFMGEASGMVLEGSRISSKKITDAGYEFKYSTVKDIIKASID